MNDQTDRQLLRDYATQRSEAAFAELVRRHVDLVYSAALRMVCDAHLAQDATQATFVALAQNANQLADRAVLSGWLHRTAQNIASKTVRTDVRRRTREQEAATMTELLSTEPDDSWEHISPQLDAALGELSEPDRDALLLRYFEKKSAQEMADCLGVSTEAAQKRVSRAVERLREFLIKRGVAVGAGGLAIALSANAVQAAPVGLALTITAAVTLAGTTVTTATTLVVTKAIAMTAIRKTLITVTLIAAVGTAVYEAQQASAWRTRAQMIAAQPPASASEEAGQAALRGKISLLVTQNAGLASAFDQLNAENTRLTKQLEQARHNTELLRELASKSASPDPGLTNAFPTKRHVFAEMGRKLRQIVQLKTQDTSKFTKEEKSANNLATINLIHDTFEVISKLDQFKTDAGTGDPHTADEDSCLLYGALDLNDQQFSQIHDLLQKYHEQAKQENLTKDDPAPETAAALKQLENQLKAELQNFLTPEQAATFAQVSPGFQLIKGHFDFNLDIGDKPQQTSPER